jgi:hypothetical protein
MTQGKQPARDVAAAGPAGPARGGGINYARQLGIKTKANFTAAVFLIS